jgi:hypothetical protein
MFRRPTLLIAFNNEHTTARVLAGLRTSSPAKLYFAVDAPRPGVGGETDAVAAVRDLTAQVDFCDELLERYRHHDRVMHIRGWATWRRAWRVSGGTWTWRVEGGT